MTRGRLVWVLLFFVLALSHCSQEPAPSVAPETSQEEALVKPEAEEGDLVALIATEKGDIAVQLFPEMAPSTVAQFRKLADLGFYSRTTFHFVSSGFILGGDPFSRDNDPFNDGRGNAAEWIEAEFDETYKVGRGSVGMMRKESDPNTSSCQFFIALKRKPEWNGRYNIFGEVIEGIEVAEKISKVPRSKDPKLVNQPAGKQIIRGIWIERRKLDVE